MELQLQRSNPRDAPGYTYNLTVTNYIKLKMRFSAFKQGFIEHITTTYQLGLTVV